MLKSLAVLLVTSLVQETVVGSRCGFNPPDGKYHSVAKGSSDNYAEFTVSCPEGLDAEVSVCVDSVSSSDTQLCRAAGAAAAGGADCSEWADGCLDISVSKDGEGASNFTIRAKASEVGVKCVLLHQADVGRGGPRLSNTFNLYTVDRESEMREEELFVSQLVLICVMNFFVGICLDLEQIREELNKVLMSVVSVGEWDPGAVFKIRAWKLGLLCQFVFLPVLAYLIGLALFRESADCSYVGDLSRLGLFLLGTAPVASYCTWVARIFDGNMDVSVLITFFSVLANPLSVLFWWWALGTDMGVNFPPGVPADLIYLYSAAIVAPILVGAVFIWLMPSCAERLAFVSPFLFVGALAGVVVLTAFHAARVSLIYSWRYMLAGIGLAVAAGMLVCLIAVLSKLERDRTVASCASVYQSAFLTHWILRRKFDQPLDEYLSIPAHSQSVCLPIVVLMVYASLCAKRSCEGKDDLEIKKRMSEIVKRIFRKREERERGKVFSPEKAEYATLNRNRIWILREELHPLWM